MKKKGIIIAVVAVLALAAVLAIVLFKPGQETPVPPAAPTQAPTETPTEAPTEAPTQAPTQAPTEPPTQAPTQALTEAPTQAPTEAPSEAPTPPPAEPAPVQSSKVVNVYNWYDYMDEEVFEIFEQETGIHVNKMYFTTNEDMMVQVRVSPGAYDLVFPSDYCVERMIAENMLAEINLDNVPNLANLDPNQLNPDYDPENKYSVPFMWGTVGILYNTKLVDDPVDSWSILWNDKYADSIIMLDSIRDTMGITLKYLGYSMNTREITELKAATDKLIEQKPIVKAYYVDETKDKMVAGEAALAVVYSGDALYSMELNEDLDYVVPKEGSNVWIDPMVIPATAKNKENAEKLINFLCRPDIAKKNCEYIWYSSPNKAAIELMGEDYTENPTINPPREVIDRCEFFHDIPDNFLTIYNSFWSQVKNAR